MEQGILISLSSYDNIIRGNTLSEMVLAGIYITHESKGNIVDNNRIVDTWFGICNRKASDHNIFINNDISLCESIGILVSESSNTEISNNNLFSNTEGIRVYESDNSKIESNIIEENSLAGFSSHQVISSKVFGAIFGQEDLPDTRKEIVEYIVQPGDSLWSIAGTFDISLDSLCWVNNLSKTSVIKPGQKLVEPQPLFSKLDDSIIEEETSRLGQKS